MLPPLALFQRVGPDAMLPDDLYLLGVALTHDGNDAGAVQVWEQARAADPKHPETLFELTRAYIAADRLLAAAETGRVWPLCPGWEARAESLLGAIQSELNDPSWRRHALAAGPGARRNKAWQCLLADRVAQGTCPSSVASRATG